MINTCSSCGRLLEEGDKVTTRIISTYHVLKSNISYALDKHDLEAIEPLTHRDCNDPKWDKIND